MVDYIKYLFLPRLGLYPLMLELYNAVNLLTLDQFKRIIFGNLLAAGNADGRILEKEGQSRFYFSVALPLRCCANCTMRALYNSFFRHTGGRRYPENHRKDWIPA